MPFGHQGRGQNSYFLAHSKIGLGTGWARNGHGEYLELFLKSNFKRLFDANELILKGNFLVGLARFELATSTMSR